MTAVTSIGPDSKTGSKSPTTMADNDQSPAAPPSNEGGPAAPSEHLNIKVTDNNNEVFFKIKRSTQLKKLMDAFCDRQGKMPTTVRFLFDGVRVAATDTPESVSTCLQLYVLW